VSAQGQGGRRRRQGSLGEIPVSTVAREQATGHRHGGGAAGQRPAGQGDKPGRPRQDDGEQKPAFQVLERTFGILEVFTEARPEWSTTDIARRLDLPVPTVHRILAALRRLGYVSQHEETKRFRLGLGAVSLGERARAVADLRPVAIGPLRRLSEATGETALLTVLTPERDRGVCLERVETPQPLRLSVQPGRQLPLHAGASQKALLAFMPDEDIDRVIAEPLERFCRSTITSPAALRRELASIMSRGWASSYEETNVGVWGVAVPVLSSSDVVCAVGIAGPSARLSAQRVRHDVGLVHEAAVILGRALGLTSPSVSTSNAHIGPPAERSQG
jgi:DNA-binding IclR family transcriptional regulator